MQKSVLVISQNEGATIQKDNEKYSGLITYSIRTCIVVIIRDFEKNIFIMQHHDNKTKLNSIHNFINKYNLNNYKIDLVWNPNPLKYFNDRGGIENLEKIKKYINKQVNIIEIPGEGNNEGGVLLTNFGEIKPNYFIINEFMNTNKKPKYTLFEEFISCPINYSPEAPQSHHKRCSLIFESKNIDLERNIPNINIFDQEREIFERHNSSVYQTFDLQTEIFLRRLWEEGIKDKEIYLEKIRKVTLNDKLQNTFFGNEIFKIYLKLPEIMRFGCSPPLNSHITDKTLIY